MENETENWAEFGLWVKRKRESKGWTQEELASSVGFADRQTIYRIEAGASTKRASVIKIAKALDMESEDAFAVLYGPSDKSTSESGRAAEAARTVRMIENWTTMTPEEQDAALAFLKFIKAEHPEALKILGPKFKVVSSDEIDQTQKHVGIEKKDKSK